MPLFWKRSRSSLFLSGFIPKRGNFIRTYVSADTYYCLQKGSDSLKCKGIKTTSPCPVGRAWRSENHKEIL